MPKQPKQYEDALGSIFDFLFEEVQKPPNKHKPMKVTDVDTASELVGALATALENPSLVVSNTAMENFAEALDIKLAEVKPNDRGLGIGFNVQDLGAMLADPDTFVDKAFGKMEGIRKSMRAAHAGEIAQSALAGMWARRNGLDWETQQSLMVAGKPAAFQGEMMRRNNELLKEHFVSGSKKMTEDDFKKRYGTAWKDRYEEYLSWEKNYATGEREKQAGIFESKKVFSVLGGHELDLKAQDPSVSKDEKSKLELARNFVDNVSFMSDLKEFTQNAQEKIKDYNEEIERLKSVPGSGKQISEIRGKIRDLKGDLDLTAGYRIAGTLGTWEGRLNTAKQYFGDGELLPSIINGKFFEDKYNKIGWIQPSAKEAIIRKVKLRDGSEEVRSVICHVGKTSGNALKDRYYESMNTLYYLSPATWVRNLATGEMFAFVAKTAEKNFLKKMEKVLAEKMSGYDKSEFLQMAINGELENILSQIANLSKGEERALKNFVRMYAGNSKLAFSFGTVARVRDKIGDFFEKTVGKGTRKVIGTALLNIGFVKTYAEEVVSVWMKNGGLYTLAKGLVIAVAKVIGFTVTGPLSSFVVDVLSTVVVDTLMKAAKPIVKFGLQTAILISAGIFGIIFLLFGPLYVMVFGQHSHVAPQDIIACGVYDGGGYQYDDTIAPVPGNLDYQCIGGESIQETYARIASDMGLSTSFELITGSDSRYTAMHEKTYCISSSNGSIYCKGDKMASMSCQGAVNLLTHELLHQVQYNNGVIGSYTALFMEWGADYLTNNGGGYYFQTVDGKCIRSTNTPSIPGCSSAELQSIAMNEREGLKTACFQNLRGYITGFCIK